MTPHTPKRWFFDFDRTLYDMNAFYVPIWNDLRAEGIPTEKIEATKSAISKTGYTFERHLMELGFSADVVAHKAEAYRQLFSRGNEFILPGVIETLRHIAKMDASHLVTFGNPEFQRQKYAGTTDLHPFMRETHFVWQGKTKGDILLEAGPGEIVFVDDTPEQLLDASQKAPWVSLIRIMWPRFQGASHPEDGKRWRVIRSMEELLP